jgi:2-oxoglutarate dehydrogenase E2 component (dihydrolipoamide succinyltransferase)
LFLGFVCSFTACKQQHPAEVLIFSEHFSNQAGLILSYITGKIFFEDGSEETCKKNFSKAHESFGTLEKMIREYPNITKHSIAKSILKKIGEDLNQLEFFIIQKTKGKDQDQFIKELYQIKKLIDSLLTEAAQRNPTLRSSLEVMEIKSYVDFFTNCLIMSIITLYLPKMGESVIEAVVLNWFVQEGKAVIEGDPLLEVATDKVDAEVPAACSGIVKTLLARKGEVVAIGAPIALLEVENASMQHTTNEKSFVRLAASIVGAIPPRNLRPISPPLQSANNIKLLLSPLVKCMAKKHGIQVDELERLIGHTKDNRITKKVLLDYLNKRITAPATPSAPGAHFFHESVTPLEGDEVLQMDRVRKLIANRMVQSKKIAPHVTSFIRADVTDLVTWRKQHKTSFEAKYGIKLTYTPIFIAAITRALQAFPLLNAVVVGDQIIKRKNINIGFAVALPNGNLLVPVVKQVEALTLLALAQQIDSLIKKARSGTITADELTGASYTISNIGSFDNLMGTPIIVQPQVAILALGAIERRPAVVYIAEEEVIAIRDEVFLSHTYDHRIIDGAIGGGFLKYLVKELGCSPG